MNRPVLAPDERFHLAVTELLEDWASANRPRFELVRVVGEEWTARSHEIRDLLDRNAVPFGFYPVDSEQGQTLLRQASPGAELPVLVLFDGQVLASPSNAELAAALGVRTRPGAVRYDLAVIGACRPAWPRRSTARPRVCPPFCWSRRPSAARPEPARASATTWASRPG